MEVLKNILIWIVVIAILYWGRGLIYRIVKDIATGVYGKAIKFISGIIFLGLLGLIISLFVK